MIPLDVRLKNFLDSVSFFADKRRQHAMWVEGDPGESFMISLGELYAQFFDDNDIDNFIADELDATPWTPEQREAVRSFRDALNNFSKAPGRPENSTKEADLVNDPEWNRVVALAKSTLAKFASSRD